MYEKEVQGHAVCGGSAGGIGGVLLQPQKIGEICRPREEQADTPPAV